MGRTITLSITPIIDEWIADNWKYNKSGKFQDLMKKEMAKESNQEIKPETDLFKLSQYRRMQIILKRLKPVYMAMVENEGDNRPAYIRTLKTLSSKYYVSIGEITKELQKELKITYDREETTEHASE